jgi:arsenite-transporting ATPase
MYEATPLAFEKRNGALTMRLHLPFAEKSDLAVHKTGDELVVSAGVFRKHVALPHAFAVASPGRARFEGDYLNVEFTPPPQPTADNPEV